MPKLIPSKSTVAMSDDLGRHSPLITLDSPSGDERPVGHVAVSLLNDGSAVAVWLHHRSSGTAIVGERVSNAGQRSDEFTIASETETALGSRTQSSAEQGCARPSYLGYVGYKRRDGTRSLMSCNSNSQREIEVIGRVDLKHPPLG